MSKSPTNSRSASRPPVDAIQYEKLALSAFELVDRQIANLGKLVTLATSIYRSPAITRDEIARQRTLLGVLIDTTENYQQEVETDRELYQIIALDAQGIPERRITARHAARLLAKAAQKAAKNGASTCATKPMPIRRVRFKGNLRHVVITH
jgi:hypothetical protein